MRNLVKMIAVVAGVGALGACTRHVANVVAGPSGFMSQTNASSSGDVQSIDGAGEVTQQEGVVYRNTINGRLEADGRVSGNFTVNIIDLSGFGEPDARATIVGKINCLSFDGDSVWFGAEMTSSSAKNLLENPALLASIGQVKVTDGQSYLFSGPAVFYTPPGTTCTDRPVLPIQPVTKGGGFHIK